MHSFDLYLLFFVVPFKVYGLFLVFVFAAAPCLNLLWFKQLNSPKQYLLSRARLSSSQFPLNKHKLKFIHQQFKGQEKRKQ